MRALLAFLSASGAVPAPRPRFVSVVRLAAWWDGVSHAVTRPGSRGRRSTRENVPQPARSSLDPRARTSSRRSRGLPGDLADRGARRRRAPDAETCTSHSGTRVGPPWSSATQVVRTGERHHELRCVVRVWVRVRPAGVGLARVGVGAWLGRRPRAGRWCVFRWCPTLPLPGGGSTIGAGGLSFRVRYGSGRFPARCGRRDGGGVWCAAPGGRPPLWGVGGLVLGCVVDAGSGSPPAPARSGAGAGGCGCGCVWFVSAY